MHVLITIVLWALKEVDGFVNEGMANNLDDLLILRKLNVSGKPCRTPRVLSFYWHPSFIGWIKVNMDKAANGLPLCLCLYWLMFCNCNGCFASSLPIGFDHI